MAAEKNCFKCGELLPLTEFYRHARMKDGHLGKCKSCTRRDVRLNYYKRHEHYAEYERRRESHPSRRRTQRASKRRQRAANPEKSIARGRVARAIKSGMMSRKGCEVCGNERTHAHHTDYSRPLDVVWLCQAHHTIAHGKVPFRWPSCLN